MFPIKAAFWTLVVAAFVPAGFHAAPDGVFAQETLRIASDFNLGDTSREATMVAEDFCSDRAETCRVVEEFGQVAGFVATMAADRAEDALEAHGERLTQEDAVLTAEHLFQQAAGEIPTR